MEIDLNFSSLALAYLMYIIAAGSPGPATLAIAGTSMRFGRQSGVAIAAGIILGSLTWGVLAAFGLSAFLSSYGSLMSFLRVLGSLYLFWLAYKSLKSALTSKNMALENATKESSFGAYFAKGLAIHLTNPKSIFGWMAIIAVGVGNSAKVTTSFLVVGGCWLIGICIFGGLALLFSTEKMAKSYISFRGWIDGFTSVIFGAAGLKLLFSSSN